MTCIVAHKTKKSLKEEIRKGVSVIIQDPSIMSSRSFQVSDIQEGETVFVTNHPQRTWFAKITRKSGMLVVS